ncbi:hypothetical protein ACJX0J_012844, partial [Zea mays]
TLVDVMLYIAGLCDLYDGFGHPVLCAVDVRDNIFLGAVLKGKIQQCLCVNTMGLYVNTMG